MTSHDLMKVSETPAKAYSSTLLAEYRNRWIRGSRTQTGQAARAYLTTRKPRSRQAYPERDGAARSFGNAFHSTQGDIWS